MVVKWEHIAVILVIWWLWTFIQKSRGHDRAPVIGGGPVSQPDKFDSIFGIGKKKKQASIDESTSIKSRLSSLEFQVSDLKDQSRSHGKNFDRMSRVSKYTPNISESVHMNSK